MRGTGYILGQGNKGPQVSFLQLKGVFYYYEKKIYRLPARPF